MQPSASLIVLAFASLLVASGCEELREIPLGVCGNLVVEQNEQCDGDAQCGTTGAAACRFTCEAGVTACPDGLACGAEGLCSTGTNRFGSYADAARYELAADRIVVADLDGDRRDDVIGLGQSLRVRFGASEMPLLASYEKPIRAPTGTANVGQLDGQPGLDVIVPTAEGVFVLVARERTLEAVPYATASALPSDSAVACSPSAGWAACRRGDIDRDGYLDRVGFVAGRDNLELEIARASGSVPITIDTLDIITDVTMGDFDGDAYADIAIATRSADGDGTSSVEVIYGGPQVQNLSRQTIVTSSAITGIAAADLDVPADGLADLAVEHSAATTNGVTVYLGSSSRDLSAPFRLDGGRPVLDVPYAVVAGEFVGGPGSGIDVMAYARNATSSGATYFWWLRGLGSAQLELGAVDPVDASQLQFLTGDWQVADLVDDASVQNGPDEVVGLSPLTTACEGPALTAAIPSARFTAVELLRSACLGVTGDGWSASGIGVVGQGPETRVLALAQRDGAVWIGETGRLGDTLDDGTIIGAEVALPPSCRDPQIWLQTPDAGSFVSWVCDGGPAGATIVGVHRRSGSDEIRTLADVPASAIHIVGDYNGDGLTDLVIRSGTTISVLPQCTVESAASARGCE